MIDRDSLIKTAIIIAGGEGSRLWPLTVDKPKAMVNVFGKPLLYWDINWLKSHGIKHIVIGVAYHKEKIIEYLREKNNFDLDIDISEHTVEGGTAEAFNLAITRYVNDEDFVGMNCDELTNMNLSKLISFHEQKKPLITMALAPFYCRFSVVDLSEDYKISNFQYGKKLKSLPVSMGVYIFNKTVIDEMPKNGSIEDLTFARLVNSGKIIGHMLEDNEYWISVNTAKDIKDAETELKKREITTKQ